jgi:hypothetical protein
MNKKKLTEEQIKALDDIILESSLWLSKKKYSKTIKWDEPVKPSKKRENNIQFVLVQVEDILQDMYFDELPFDSKITLEEKLEIFNHMPQLLQGDCIKWGANDTEVRTEIGRWMVEAQLGISYDEYWDSDIYQQQYEDDFEHIKIDLKKFYI